MKCRTIQERIMDDWEKKKPTASEIWDYRKMKIMNASKS